jgi:recombination protein RecT
MNAITEVRTQLTRMAPELAKVLPDHVSPERFERITLTALQRAPDLLGCDRKSLFESVMQCAQDGLIPDGREAALTKFGNKVAYMPMVAGILKKVRQSGELSTITAHIIYKGDEFRYWIDDEGEHLTHTPDLMSEQAEALGVYALARTKDGGVYIEVLRMSEVKKIRSVSRGANNGPWAQWFEQMAKKSAIRRLAKRLPMSTDVENVIQRDDQFYPYQEKQVAQATSAISALTAADPEPDAIDTDTSEIIEADAIERDDASVAPTSAAAAAGDIF